MVQASLSNKKKVILLVGAASEMLVPDHVDVIYSYLDDEMDEESSFILSDSDRRILTQADGSMSNWITTNLVSSITGCGSGSATKPRPYQRVKPRFELSHMSRAPKPAYMTSVHDAIFSVF
eukprot:TRINITY_DN19543_c0_g1_i1.p1 TRINITY_DN19543_c0_g1~~TRINITY_DN19543_c0_g1_i1.p1  ORF type:complete len:121 (+),score=18.21 TRINITY_DN19543_c0_g1_i1:52-414(+)